MSCKFNLNDEDILNNLINETKDLKNLNNLKVKSIEQQKVLNKLINVYEHKIMNEKKKTYKYAPKLPMILNNNQKQNFKTLKEYLNYKKKIFEENKKNDAKRLKEKMNIIKENFQIYKNNIKNQNKSIRKYIDSNHLLLKDSIIHYQQLKKQKAITNQKKEIDEIRDLNRIKMNKFNQLKNIFNKTLYQKNNDIDKNLVRSNSTNYI